MNRIESTSRGVGLLVLALVFGCGEAASSGSPAGSGGTVPGESGGSASGEPAARGGAEASGAGALPTGGMAQGGFGGLPSGGTVEVGGGAGSDGGAPEVGSGGSSLGGAPDAGSGGRSQGGAPEAGSGGWSQGGAGAPSQPMLEPVRVVRGDPSKNGFWDRTIRGVALDEYEGKVATVRIGMPDRAPERLGSGQARIDAGEFELSLPQVWEDSLYKRKLVYIDVDGDGACDLVNDKMFADFRASAAPELVVRGSGAPQQFEFFPSVEPMYCAAFNSEWPSQ